MARAAVLLAVCVLALAGAAAGGKKVVGVYELKNSKGDFSVKITNWGATIMSVHLPDNKGISGDVVLGYDTVAPYVNNTPYFGALVGRVGNRIAGARFVLDGKVYHLFANNGKNTLHGGHRGFSHQVWTVKEQRGGDSPYITLYYHSYDGDQGFPGALDVYVTYQISGPYELSVHMNATALNKATPVNLLQHTYWNLGGQCSGPITHEMVQILASRITPVDSTLIPTGQYSPVAGTPFDFLTPEPVGSRIGEVAGGGYDINYVVDGTAPGLIKKVAVVSDDKTGRRMEVWADKPGVQFYTSNFLNGTKGKGGCLYPRHGALCLETQDFPDAVHHPNFPSIIVAPGETYRHNMIYKFSFFAVL